MPALQPQSDPNVKLPPAVLANAAKADELFKQAYETEPKEPATPEPQEPAEPAAKDTPAEPPLKVTPEGNEPPAKDAKPKDFEHAYNSMKGRFERSQAQITTMAEQISNLQAVIAGMETAPKETPTELRAERLITDKDVADYGSDLLDVVGRKAKEEVGGEVETLKRQVADLTNKLGKVGVTVQQDAKSRMYQTLDDGCSNWREINTDPKFLSWVRLPDPFSGVIRLELMKAAFAQNQGARVLAFFNGFLAEEAATDPASSAGRDEPAETPAEKVPLETLAAPGRAKSAAQSGPAAEKPTFTRAQIAKFYLDVQRGKFAGKDAEKDSLERQIIEATREGRIIETRGGRR